MSAPASTYARPGSGIGRAAVYCCLLAMAPWDVSATAEPPIRFLAEASSPGAARSYDNADRGALEAARVIEPLGVAPPPVEAIAAEQQTPRRLPVRQFRPITEVTADATLPEGLLPEQVGRQQGDVDPASAMPEMVDLRLADGWADQPFFWSATHLCHGPLYFEQVNLERYGYQCHPVVQPFVSGAHFFLTVPTLPYQMTVHPPRECIYTLGYYRPGDRVPWRRQRLPWDARAAAVEATVAVGLIFLIP